MEAENQNTLIVFDVEGILIPKTRFLLFEVAGRMGLWTFIKASFIGLLYATGLIPLKKALKSLYNLFKGLSLERLLSFFQAVPLMPGVENVFQELKKDGFKTALISSGIPTVALEKLNEKLRADCVCGLELGLSEGVLTGEIRGDVVEPEGKAVALRRILSGKGLSPRYCVGVADDRNNVPMFQLCDLKIGYNPDFVLSWKSDHVVKGELSAILPIIKGKKVEGEVGTPSKSSMSREAIHIGGFAVSLICAYLIDRYAIAFLLFLFAVVYLLAETKRILGTNTPVITDVTMNAAGKLEFKEFVAAPLFYAAGIIMSLVLFPEPVGYVAVTVLTLGDGFAAICGERVGWSRVPFNKVKNFEGTACGFIFAFLGSLIFVDLFRALVASAVGMVAEILPLPVNDNLTIPLAAGLALIVVSPFL
ncbi:MAG: haloacid dehalogenase-like hydrolase [Candidatus Bathyarchaeota archaeon]|nr:haloacid dehalogenase-like hydrolase [Candidatus Bathyarchaeota archaeon]